MTQPANMPTTLRPQQIKRSSLRQEIGLLPNRTLVFTGADIWSGHELSWLNRLGKPQVGIIRWIVPCQSEFTLSAAAMQTYLHQFAQRKFISSDDLQKQIEDDLSQAVGMHVKASLLTASEITQEKITPSLGGISLDRLFIEIPDVTINATPAITLVDPTQKPHHEVLSSDLLCALKAEEAGLLMGSIQIEYTGSPINHENLLRYLVSYRQKPIVSTNLVEKIFTDLLKQCRPQKLRIYACFGQEHGITQNILRSTTPESLPPYTRLPRQ